jgi:hypothetical protein
MRPLATLFFSAALSVSIALPSLVTARDPDDTTGQRADRESTGREAAESMETGVYRGRRLTASKENLPQLQLALSDAIETGIQHNLNVEVQRFNPMIAGEAADAAWGAYDPNLSLDMGYADA